MPTGTTLSRVGKYDFFAILGSGTYVLGGLGPMVTALLNGTARPTAHGTLSWIGVTLERHWSFAVASLFLAFLFGNVLRALPVNLADDWWNSWLGRHRRKPKADERSGYHRALHGMNPFPYGDMLEMELQSLKLHLPDLDFAVPPQGARHSMFNFWKSELCRESPAAFEFTQELEGRVRLFATMVWAALLSFLAGVIGSLLCAFGILGLDWKTVMISQMAFSALICLVFGSQLRRVRGQEVASVFLSYVSLTLDRARRRSTYQA
jgi:hypothetical protein